MLKSLLSLLLSKFYSKKESELVGHQAMPSESMVAVQVSPTSVTDWTQVASYTAPTDGYISVRGMSLESGSVLQIMAGDHNVNPSISTSATTYGQWPQTVMPVKKGRNIAVYCGQTSNISVFFNKAIGGGYQALKNALLQGGGLCLKVWFSSLRRSSLPAKRNGWQNSLVQNCQPLTLLHRPQEIGRNLSLRKQDTFALRQMLSKFLFRYSGFGRVVSPMKKATRALRFTWKKDKPSRISYLLTQKALTLLSTEQRVSAHNLSIGGASC